MDEIRLPPFPTISLYAKEVMIPCPPRLRRDLTYRHEHTAEGICVIIKHPVSRRFFRLEHAEYFIAQQLDGQTPIETIRQRTEATFDAELPVEDLYAFVQTLKKNGLLETEDALKKDQRRKPKRFRGSLLYCRVQVCDPCQLLKKLAQRTKFLFTRFFVALSAMSILLAITITAANWREFREDLPRLYDSSAAPAIILILFAVIVAHEFGHGVTCTHFGGEVHEMGFAMIFLMPAFYCNVSDAWLFRERSKRLWVGFAGPYFELFLWSLAVFLWRITEPATWINFVALSVMATSGAKTLLNFNPLIKLDGYYLLSDYLELPNLRKRSFRQVGSFLERVSGFGTNEEEKLTKRERRIFWIYGTIALAGSFSILGYILVGAGSTLVAGRTPAAVLAMLLLLFMKFRRRFRRMFAAPNGAAGSLDDMDFDTHEEDDEAAEPDSPNNQGYLDAAGKSAPLHQPVTMKNERTTDTAVIADEKDYLNGSNGPGPNSEVHSESDGSNATIDSILDAMYGRRIRAMQSGPSVSDHQPRNSTREVSSEGKGYSTFPALEEPVPAVQPAQDEPKPNKHKQETKPERQAKPEKKKSRRRGSYVRRIIWLALAASGAVASFYVHWEAQASGPLNILPVRNADVRTEIDGLVDEVRVTEGMVVRKGDLVARLSTRENKSALEQAEGQIQQLQAQLRFQIAGPTPEEIDVARTAVVKAKDNLKFAEAKLEATKQLFENKLVARLELDTAEQLYATSKDDLADAQGKLQILLNGTRPEQIDQTRAQISSLQAQQRFLEGQIKRADVRSPVDGIVATPELELKELAGQVVPKGALIAKVFELQKTTVQIAVPENEIPDVKVGQKVVLKVRAYPNETFNGAVTSIATSAFAPASSEETTLLPTTPTPPGSNSAPKTILVTTQIDNRSMLLKPGMTGHAKIFCGRRRLIDLVNRRLARTVKVQFWSWW
jgi:multidrug resistance efflux pump